MSRLKREDTTLHYEFTGAGPPILLTHGFGATSRMWKGQESALAPTHRMITWDMRGHGRSVSAEDGCVHSEEATVADMGALLDELGHSQAVIAGHSLGGYMSLAFYRAHPQRVRALVIIDTGPGYKSEAARETWNEMALAFAARLQRNGLETLAKMSEEMDASEHASATGLAAAARGMLTQRDSAVIESLPEISVPTLIIVGQNDRDYLNATDTMASKIPGARKVVIPDAGHAVNLHQPELFNEALGRFLAELVAEGR